MNFMNVDLAKSLNLKITPHRIRCMVADGRIVKSQGKVTIPVSFDDDAQGAVGEGHGYLCDIDFVLLPLPHTDAILGLPFLTKHNPMVDWQKKIMKFPEFDENATVHIQVKPRPAIITLLNAQQMAKLMRKNRTKGEKSQAQFFYASLRELHDEVCA